MPKSNDEYVEEIVKEFADLIDLRPEGETKKHDYVYHHLRTTLITLLEAKDREIEKREIEILATITALQQSLDNAPLIFPQDMDITEVPDGLAHELRGMKKGWHAALEQLKLALAPTKTDKQ